MSIEDERYALQQLLDSQKDNKERNILGQFSTPFLLAKEMAEYVLSLEHETPIRFLEPSIGTGVFFSALKQSTNVAKAVGYEIDPHYFNPTRSLWAKYDLELIRGDFFKQNANRDFNLILANPPYTRHHHIDNDAKKYLKEKIYREFGITISGLSGLYCYFLILSTLWLKEGGLSCWLIPSEFLDVNYGTAIKKFLCDKVDLISIHKYNPSDLQFSDALVSSSIVTFRNKSPKNHLVKFTNGCSLLNPTGVNEVSLSSIDPHSKWNVLFDGRENETEIKGNTIGEYFKVSRGISTGNNSFFIIPYKEVVSRQLPDEFLVPVLPAPRHLKFDKIHLNFDNIVNDNRLYMMSCPLPIDVIKNKYPSLYEYIIEGEQRKANFGYNCKKRSPWYLTETRAPAPIYMTYMGRGEYNSKMFRFILNESNAIVTNSYLILYPKDKYKHCFVDKVTTEKVWSILNSIPKDRLARCGRTYGGGLFKIEPKELESLIVPELDGVLTPIQGNLFDFGR